MQTRNRTKRASNQFKMSQPFPTCLKIKVRTNRMENEKRSIQICWRHHGHWIRGTKVHTTITLQQQIEPEAITLILNGWIACPMQQIRAKSNQVVRAKSDQMVGATWEEQTRTKSEQKTKIISLNLWNARAIPLWNLMWQPVWRSSRMVYLHNLVRSRSSMKTGFLAYRHQKTKTTRLLLKATLRGNYRNQKTKTSRLLLKATQKGNCLCSHVVKANCLRSNPNCAFLGERKTLWYPKAPYWIALIGSVLRQEQSVLY